MLIDSNEIRKRIIGVMEEIEESELNFSVYKSIMGCMQELMAVITELETKQAANNVGHDYAEALQGLRDK